MASILAPISITKFGSDTLYACLRNLNVSKLGGSLVTTTISAVKLVLSRVPHAYGPTMSVSTTTTMDSDVEVCCLFLSENSFSFSDTVSMSCCREFISDTEGVRASSFAFNLLSSSGLVGVLVRVDVK